MTLTRSTVSATSTAISIIAAALIALGIVMVFSASASLNAPPLTQHIIKNPSFRQALFSIAGLVTLLMVGLCPYDSWRMREHSLKQPALWLLAVVVVLLAAVLVPGIGEERNGARRWLSLGPGALGLGFQPSELAKLAVVVFVAARCAQLGDRIQKFWTGLLPMIIVLGIIGALVGKEDFGTAALLFGVGFCILIGAGARLWHIALLSMPAIAGAVALVIAAPYRVQRVMSFLDPMADPQGAGYHQIQSLITIASGGWWGRGLGAGIQKYGYLPEGRTDFIFAVICEELGVVGGAAIIALFAILVWQGRKAMLRADTDLGRLIALGATLMIGLQAAMNVAVVTVSVPTKGIGLPLVSAGGTGVVFFSVLVGLLVNVARARPDTITDFEDASMTDSHRIGLAV
ncbi:MAG: putative peptidoglycan glycosyltransferase FtsW [Planctomycetota bacterium]|mgnify:CR=1 FL=1